LRIEETFWHLRDSLQNLMDSGVAMLHGERLDGQLPARRLSAVEFPGVLSSGSAALALAALGSRDGSLVAALDSSKTSVELRLRPEDPLCQPIAGRLDARPQALLLRVLRKRRRVVGAEVVGVVDRVYRFEELADFSCGAAASTGGAGAVAGAVAGKGESGVPPSTSALMVMAPPSLSQHKQPESYAFQPNLHPPRPRVRVRSVAPDCAAEQIPAGAQGACCAQDAAHHAAVQRLLEERPVWSRLALQQRCAALALGVDSNALSRMLSLSAYRFEGGPWGGLWVRAGYDPRTDAAAHAYQAIGFSELCDEQQFERRQQAAAAKEEDEDEKEQLELREEHRFEAPPRELSAMYQLCDLTHERLLSIVAAGAASRRQSCHPLHGWHSGGTLEQLRSAMLEITQAWLGPGGAEDEAQKEQEEEEERDVSDGRGGGGGGSNGSAAAGGGESGAPGGASALLSSGFSLPFSQQLIQQSASFEVFDDDDDSDDY